MFRGKQARFITEGVDEATIVRGRPEVLKAVLQILFENAQQGATELTLWSLREGEAVSLGVQDNGRGVANNRDKIFDPFFTTQRESGTGLGLTIAAAMLKSCQGRIELVGDLLWLKKENYLRNTKINFEIELIQSKKNLLDTRYRLTRKKRAYEQNKELYEEELISKEDYLQSKEDYEYEVSMLEINKLKAKNDSLIRATSMITLENDLEKMRETLKLVHERLDNLNVKAPVDGQLGMLDAEIGQSIGQGQRIGLIHVLTNYKVEALIDEHYIDRVRRNLSASFDRNNEDYALNVKKVYPEVRDGQFEIDMVFKGEKPDNIRTGQTYHIKLQLGQSEEAVLISKGGFFQSTGGQWVYVLNENETEATKRSIRIGKQNPQYYEVLEGLEAGEKVITSSYDLFGDNDKIVFK